MCPNYHSLSVIEDELPVYALGNGILSGVLFIVCMAEKRGREDVYALCNKA